MADGVSHNGASNKAATGVGVSHGTYTSKPAPKSRTSTVAAVAKPSSFPSSSALEALV